MTGHKPIDLVTNLQTYSLLNNYENDVSYVLVFNTGQNLIKIVDYLFKTTVKEYTLHANRSMNINYDLFVFFFFLINICL